MLRSKDLCPEPANCPAVLTEEPLADYTALPCDGCPRQALNEYLDSPEGALIQAVIDLDYALQMGVAVRLREIPYPSFLLLRQLIDEREKYKTEEIRKSSAKRGH